VTHISNVVSALPLGGNVGGTQYLYPSFTDNNVTVHLQHPQGLAPTQASKRACCKYNHSYDSTSNNY
jgi:hypothetical protein